MSLARCLTLMKALAVMESAAREVCNVLVQNIQEVISCFVMLHILIWIMDTKFDLCQKNCSYPNSSACQR